MEASNRMMIIAAMQTTKTEMQTLAAYAREALVFCDTPLRIELGKRALAKVNVVEVTLDIYIDLAEQCTNMDDLSVISTIAVSNAKNAAHEVSLVVERMKQVAIENLKAALPKNS